MSATQTIYRGLRRQGWTAAEARKMAETIHAAGGLYLSPAEIEGLAA